MRMGAEVRVLRLVLARRPTSQSRDVSHQAACGEPPVRWKLVGAVVAVGGWVGVAVGRWRGRIAVDYVRVYDGGSLLDDGWGGRLSLDYDHGGVLLLGVVGLLRRVGLLDWLRVG